MIGGWLDQQMLRSVYYLFSVGMNVVAGTLVGYGIGWWLDERVFGGRTSPWFMVVFLLVGTAGGFFTVIKVLKSRTSQKMRDELGIGNVFEDTGEAPPGPPSDDLDSDADDDDYDDDRMNT
jgi:F0F1-type ATP synthase assembly protein I